MKKLITLLLAASMGTALMCGCSADTSSETETSETVAEETEAASQAGVSDWEMNDDRQALFDAAMDGFVGVDYVPLLCLGTPDSNPLGTTFLCRSAAVVPDAESYWAFVTVQDVGSEVTIEDIKFPQYAHSTTADTMYLSDDPDELMEGGFYPTQDLAVTAELAEAFYEVAPEDVADAQLCALLATQETAGTNYCILINADGEWKCAFITVSDYGNFLLTVADLTL